jgi:hypothetical protein
VDVRRRNGVYRIFHPTPQGDRGCLAGEKGRPALGPLEAVEAQARSGAANSSLPRSAG